MLLSKETNQTKTGHIRIINLFPFCYMFLIYIKNMKKINRTSSDLKDKIIQHRHRKEEWEGIEEGWRVFSLFSPLPVFLFHFIAGWNNSELIFYFYFLNSNYFST